MASEKDAGKQSAVKLVPLLITVAVGLIIWFIPAPSGLEPKAWHLFAIFVATIIGFISKPLPMGAIAIFALAVTALTGTLSIEDTLSGFGIRPFGLSLSHSLFPGIYQNRARCENFVCIRSEIREKNPWTFLFTAIQ